MNTKNLNELTKVLMEYVTEDPAVLNVQMGEFMYLNFFTPEKSMLIELLSDHAEHEIRHISKMPTKEYKEEMRKVFILIDGMQNVIDMCQLKIAPESVPYFVLGCTKWTEFKDAIYLKYKKPS